MRSRKEPTGVNNVWMVIVFFSIILPAWRQAGAEEQVSQFGITWTFNGDYPVGRFANGDYWVVGPVTLVAIDPASVRVGDRVINGSMVNPSPRLTSRQGYDSGMYGQYASPTDYDSALNKARPNREDLSADNPLVLGPDSSLVSTISTADTSGRTQLQTAAILTVLDAPAPEGSFRPAYSGEDKTVRHNKSELDYSLLAHLRPTPGVVRLSDVERYFERPWLDHIPGWQAGSHHPVENMPNYGGDIATNIGVGALTLQLDFADSQKETLLIRYVQLGIDLYGVLRDGGRMNWVNNGGHAGGRKWPILFAGLVLSDPNMTNIGQKSGDYLYSEGYGPGNEPPDYTHFGEDDQTFYVTAADVEITHSPQWNPDSRDAQRIPYEVEDINLPEWGITHATVPGRSNKFWYTAYRQISSPAWGGFVLAAHIMGAKELWNHDALFDYYDRYMDTAVDWRQTSKFVENMWDTYRASYGAQWKASANSLSNRTGGRESRRHR
ncbi:MAG: hypothetical protein P8Z79_11725 [Sedimentisphaerales bacterium]|jgi:hypothetical protein